MNKSMNNRCKSKFSVGNNFTQYSHNRFHLHSVTDLWPVKSTANGFRILFTSICVHKVNKVYRSMVPIGPFCTLTGVEQVYSNRLNGSDMFKGNRSQVHVSQWPDSSPMASCWETRSNSADLHFFSPCRATEALCWANRWRGFRCWQPHALPMVARSGWQQALMCADRIHISHAYLVGKQINWPQVWLWPWI